MKTTITTESGFSLIELVVAMAIVAMLTAAGIGTLTPLIEQFEEKAAAIEMQQQNQADELQFYLDSIAN